MGLAHIVEAYIVITWSDFRSVFGDTLTKCIVTTPGFMKMEMDFSVFVKPGDQVVPDFYTV